MTDKCHHAKQLIILELISSHVENRFHFKRCYKERILTNSAALDFYLKIQI